MFIRKEDLGEYTPECTNLKSLCDFYEDDLYATKHTFSYGAMLVKMCYYIGTFEKIDFGAPTLLIAGKHDKLVNFKFTEELYERIQGTEKEFLVFDESAHEPLNDQNREKFIGGMLDWMDTQMKKNGNKPLEGETGIADMNFELGYPGKKKESGGYSWVFVVLILMFV